MADSTFGFKTPQGSPGFLLWQTTTLWQRGLKATLEKHNLTHAQFVVLATLLWLEEQGKETTQVDIINLSKLDKMTVSNCFKQLGEKGYVKRCENPNDARAKSVSLTLTGKSHAQKLVRIVENGDSLFFGPLSVSEQVHLKNALRKLVRTSDK